MASALAILFSICIVHLIFASRHADILKQCSHDLSGLEKESIYDLHELNFAFFSHSGRIHVCGGAAMAETAIRPLSLSKINPRSREERSSDVNVIERGKFSLQGKDVTVSVIGLEPYIVYTPQGVKGAEVILTL